MVEKYEKYQNLKTQIPAPVKNNRELVKEKTKIRKTLNKVTHNKSMGRGLFSKERMGPLVSRMGRKCYPILYQHKLQVH